jgi:hypothetical protein
VSESVTVDVDTGVGQREERDDDHLPSTRPNPHHEALQVSDAS